MEYTERLESSQPPESESATDESSSPRTKHFRCRRRSRYEGYKKTTIEAATEASTTADEDEESPRPSASCETNFGLASTAESTSEPDELDAMDNSEDYSSEAEEERKAKQEEYIWGLSKQEQIVFKVVQLLQHMSATTASSKSSHAESKGKRRGACRFRSVSMPKLSLSGYASRIEKYFGCTVECYVMCMLYIDRIVKMNPDFEVSDLTCHRLLLVSIMVATKFHDDIYASNEYFAKVGGIQLDDLNKMEAEFVKLLKWNLYMTADEYEWFLNTLRELEA